MSINASNLLNNTCNIRVNSRENIHICDKKYQPYCEDILCALTRIENGGGKANDPEIEVKICMCI